MTLIIGIDVGGTFTDAVAYDTTSEKMWVTKVISTPEDPSEAFSAAVKKMIAVTDTPPERIERVVHGTTVGTNTIITKKGATVGILTTQGFEDILVMGRQKRSNMYDLLIGPETPLFLAPRRRIKGIPERIDAEGIEVLPLDEERVSSAIEDLVNNFAVDSIAVCYLFSFMNPKHELRTKEIINEKYPQMRVSLSSAIDPRFREYERLCVTAFDAYIGPKISAYFQRLKTELHQMNIPAELQIMQSSGGIAGVETVLSKTVNTVLSGPAAGAISGQFIGELVSCENVITLDMGGTSNDVALIQKGKPLLSYEGKVENYPLRVPMIDVNCIGAGGGSIAWIDAGGALRVGPQSAGADPGPACYGKGGSEATVTDASVVLGYLNPNYFAGGDFCLDPKLAWDVIENRIAKPLGLDVPQAALGIHRIVNANMSDQLRLVTVKRGFDPREFTLVPLGGAGPVNAGVVAADLSIKKIVVPRTPGVLSAFGLLVAQIQHEHAKTLKKNVREVDIEELNKAYLELDYECKLKMSKEKVFENVQITHYAEMRYVGQSYELEVQLLGTVINQKVLNEAITKFHNLHDQIYGHHDLKSPVEIVTLRSVHSFQLPRPNIIWEPKGKSLTDARKGERLAYFEGEPEAVLTFIYQREFLPPGVLISGPAIVEQLDTTTVIYPNQSVTVDKWGNLIIDVLSFSKDG
jgi:N-methylhydantoinase A